MRLMYRNLTGFIGLIIVLFLAVSFPVTVIAANQAQQEDEKELLLDQIWGFKGFEFFRKEEYSLAIECLQKAFKLNPREITWPLVLSKLYRTIEKFPEAQQVLAEVWRTFPEEENRKQMQMARADLHFFWGKNLEKKYDFLNAIKHYEEAYNIDKDLRPKDAAADLNNIGFIYDTLGEKEKALGYYEQALPIWRAMGDRAVEATTLNNIGPFMMPLVRKEKPLAIMRKYYRYWWRWATLPVKPESLAT